MTGLTQNLFSVSEQIGETSRLLSREDFPVNRTVLQENVLEKKMNAIYGRKCLESYGKFSRNGLWAKMFSELLVGTMDWSSMRCRLIWRLRGTKYNRLYFQLVPSTPRTEGIGLGLLPTENLLPTPNARDEKNGSKMEDGRTQRKIEQGWTFGLNDIAVMGMLPTPATSNYKGASSTEALESRGRLKNKADNLADQFAISGKSAQLNPAFVGEMMGFPPDWTLKPFIDGGREKGKPTDFSNFPTFNPTISKGEIKDMNGITASKWRNESIKSFGNAIVPEVAFNIFKVINKYNSPSQA